MARLKAGISEYQRGLQKAKQKGDGGKIARREHKLKEAQAKLKQLQTRHN